MFSIEEKDESIHFKISSEMKLVDRTVREAREFMNHQNTSEFSGTKLVLRELLINAVEHGNKKIPSKTVDCSVEKIGDYRFKINVKDEGEGFDYKNINMLLPEDPSKLRSRGFPIINALADGVEFNNTGNSITAYVTVECEAGFDLTEEDGWNIITPHGDITASTADQFREFLLKLVHSNENKYRFNFEGVEDIDSVGLSTLIVLYRSLKDSAPEIDLEIVNASENLRKLFRMTRLDTIYNVA